MLRAKTPKPQIAAALVSAVLMMGTAAHAQQQADADVAAARAAFERGVAALQATRYADAAATLEESYRLRPSPVVLYNLGLALRALERRAEAVDAFDRYLARPERDAPADRLAAVRDEVARLRAALVTLQLDLAPPDAALTVDGRPTTPRLGSVALDAGVRVLEVSAGGYQPWRRTLAFAPGARQPLVAHLAPLSSSGAAHDASVLPRYVLIAVGGGVALITAGVATGLWIGGNETAQAYEARCSVPSPPAACAGEMRTTQAALDSRSAVVNVLWGVAAAGGIAAGVGLVLALTAPSERAPSAVSFVVAPTYAGVRATW